jgi:hypothetical protein
MVASAEQTTLENRLPIPDIFSSTITPADEAVTISAPVIPAQKVEKTEDESYLSFILDALETAVCYADTLRDEGTRASFKNKLTRSGVNGSEVQGIHSMDDVVAMFTKAKGWKMVFNADENVDVYQAVLAQEYQAFTAYASLNEIKEVYGDPVLSTVQLKIGRIDDQVYACTVQRVLTDVLTVQVRKDGNGVARVEQWFAGIDVKVRQMNPAKSIGDALCRCGVKILPIKAQREIAAQKRERRERWRNPSNGQHQTR